jgi:aminopeptidase N
MTNSLELQLQGWNGIKTSLDNLILLTNMTKYSHQNLTLWQFENVGLVTFDEIYCWTDPPTQSKRSKFCIYILHEMAHMWFGNLVTMKWWDDLWLNESFATFISFLCQSQAVGNEYTNSWVEFSIEKGTAFREDQLITTHPVVGDITDTDKAQSHFDGIVYEKGSAILKQMFYFIGEENFSKGLKEYFKIYAWKNTVFDDFVDQMVIALGDKNTFNLKYLCNEWIGKSGLNEIEAEWDSEKGHITEVRVKQRPCLTEHANLQTHMMDILLIYDIGKSEILKNVIINNKEVTVINTNNMKSPKAVILNYNDWSYIKWVVDRESLIFLSNNIYSINSCDLLTRQLFYRSLYDMVKDAKISITKYLDIVNKLLKQETEAVIINTYLRYIISLITYYVPSKFYTEYSSLMFDTVSYLLVRHISNKDITTNLMDILISFATTDEHTKLLMNWLTVEPFVISNGNKITLSNELLNQDIRFSIVSLIFKSLEISNEDKQKILQAEMERDKYSDRSIRVQCKCQAILPHKEYKVKIWNKIINEPNSESLYNMKSYMAGFAPIQQLDLVKEFLADKFFDDAKTLENQEHFYIDAFVGYCSPVFEVEDEKCFEKIDKLAQETQNNSLQRRLYELMDDMRRYAKAQKLFNDCLSKKIAN